MLEKKLEIALESTRDVKHRRYFTVNYRESCDDVFFEGTTLNGKRITPLSEAKIWAKNKGYTHIEIVSFKLSKQNRLIQL